MDLVGFQILSLHSANRTCLMKGGNAACITVSFYKADPALNLLHCQRPANLNLHALSVSAEVSLTQFLSQGSCVN